MAVYQKNLFARNEVERRVRIAQSDSIVQFLAGRNVLNLTAARAVNVWDVVVAFEMAL
jgi:hypothetical protein